MKFIHTGTEVITRGEEVWGLGLTGEGGQEKQTYNDK